MKSRVFDCFTFFNELDLLEIRLSILDEYVDYFVLVESAETFSGHPKPLFYYVNESRFDRWKDKIIYFMAPSKDFPDAFQRAGFQKDYIRQSLMKYNLSDEDNVYFGDVDEIWNPQEIIDDKVYNLRQLNYSYYLNNRSSEEWVGTIVGKWKTIKTKSLNEWRANHENVLDNGGWHFTNMGGADQIKKKLGAYDHQEMNTRENHILLEDRMKDGEDYAGRPFDWQGKPFTFWESEVDWPQYLIDNRNKWKKLLRS